MHGKRWGSSKQGKAWRKHRTNAKSIEMVRDKAYKRVNTTYLSAGIGGTGVVSNWKPCPKTKDMQYLSTFGPHTCIALGNTIYGNGAWRSFCCVGPM